MVGAGGGKRGRERQRREGGMMTVGWQGGHAGMQKEEMRPISII